MRNFIRLALAFAAVLAAQLCAPLALAQPVPPPAAAPRPAAPKAVELEELLAYADDHSPLLRLARAQVAAGDAEIEAAAPLLPGPPGIAVALGQRSSSGGTGLEVGIDLSQRLAIGGQRGARLHLAERLRDALRADADTVRWEVHRRAHGAWAEVLLARERALLAARLVNAADAILQVSERRLKGGEESAAVLVLTRADRAQARQAQVQAEQDSHIALLTLAEIAGWPLDQPLLLAGEMPPLQKVPALPGLLQRAREQHPSVRARKADLARAEANRALQNRLSIPDPTVGLRYGREGDANAAQVVQATLAVSLPFWNVNVGDVARARAEVIRAQSELTELLRTLDARVARAAARVDAAATKVALYGEEIGPAFEKNMQILQRALALGEADLAQVSLANQRLAQVQGQALTAKTEYFQAVAELEALLGAEVWLEGGVR